MVRSEEVLFLHEPAPAGQLLLLRFAQLDLRHDLGLLDGVGDMIRDENLLLNLLSDELHHLLSQR